MSTRKQGKMVLTLFIITLGLWVISSMITYLAGLDDAWKFFGMVYGLAFVICAAVMELR